MQQLPRMTWARGRLVAAVLTAAAMAALVSACGDSDSTRGEASTGSTVGVTDDSISFTASTGISGNFAVVTGPYIQAAQASLAQVNEEDGGVFGREIVWSPTDDGFDVAKATSQAQKAASSDEYFGAALPFGTNPSLAAQRVYQAKGIPFLAMGSTRASTAPENTTSFGCVTPDYYLIRIGVEYAVDETGATKVASVVYNTPDGEDVEAGVKDQAEASGVELVESIGIDPGTTDFSGPIGAIKSSGAEVVALYASTPDISNIVSAAKRAQLDVQFVGPSPAADPLLVSLSKDAVEGMIAVSVFRSLDSDDPAIVQFKEAITEFAPDKSQAEPTYWALTGYHCANLLAEGVRSAGEEPTRESFVEGMETITDFDDGLSAPVSYSEDDHTGGTEGIVLQIENGEYIEKTGFVSGDGS